MVDIAVKSGAAWVCHAQEPQLAEVLLPVDVRDNHEDESEGDMRSWGPPVLLQQAEEGSPCVLTLHCSPGSAAVISRLLLTSEARTMEVYSQTGEYCGTVRGERDESIQPESPGRGPFYRKQLILEPPSSACEVKLLSLGGRSSVLVCRVVACLQQLEPGPARGPGIDMQQVQCLVEEMGTSLSPGAQNLMEMVHFQQKNQTGSLGSFLPLLMGGGLSTLAQAATISPPVGPADSTPAEEAPPAQNGTPADVWTSASSPEWLLPALSTGGMTSHAQMAEMMSHFLTGQGRQQVLSSGPDLLPVLQNVCGQVTKLRLDGAAETDRRTRNGAWELDSVMERRLEEMERRLKEHVDHRMDALEQKLERVLLSVLPKGGHEQLGVQLGVQRSAGAEPPDAAERLT